MKELIVKLNADYTALEFIQYRIDAAILMAISLDNIGEKSERINFVLSELNEEKKQILDTMLSTSSQITKLLYDGNI